jgi:hypothetical protein
MVHRRNSHADQPLDVAQVGRLLGVAERDCDTRRSGTRGTDDAMHVGFRNVWNIEIDHVADAVDVDGAGGDIGGDQRAHLPVTKGGKHPFALVL